MPAGWITKAEANDQKFVENVLYKLGPLAAPVHHEFKRHNRRDHQHANLWLREVGEAHDAAPVSIRKIKDLQGLDAQARTIARRCFGELPRVTNLLNADLLAVPPGTTDAAILARAADWQYWRRVLRRLVCRYRDQLQRQIGLVHKRKMVYCADQTVAWQAQRQRANLDTLRKTIMVSDLNPGEEITLAEIAKRSVANPEIRRAEIMVRIRGMEDFDPDAEAAFITLTCPSSWHCRHSKTGAPNLRWNSSTPKEANDYLALVWSRIRAKLARDGIPVYGIRIAEPHHDGTPHWHFLLFHHHEHRKPLQDIFRTYALAEDGDERGAKQHRVKFEWIDKAKGSATGYVVKYIAKSIDGFGVGEDWFGSPAEHAANRIVAWARTWGIRQFQQIGSASVTVWREYRRIRDVMEACPPHHVPWICASGTDDLKCDWAGFMKCMGGATPGRDQPSRLERGTRVSTVTGECSPVFNRYGERLEGSKRPIIGVVRDGMLIETHPEMWLRKTDAGEPAQVDVDNVDWSINARRNLKRFKGARAYPSTEELLLSSPVSDPGFAGTWTRDNNCTRAPPMAEQIPDLIVNPILEDLKNFDTRRKKVVDDLPPEHRDAVAAILADAAGWMNHAAELIPQ